MTEFVAIPAITVLCYLAAELYKSAVGEEQNKHIPVLCGLCGGMLGVASYLLIPGYLPAENVLVAAAVGVASGWSATGINQAIKQQGRNDR